MSEDAISSKKLNYLQQKNLTPADKLREILTRLENRQTIIAQLDSPQALEILHDLDQAYFFLTTQENVDLLAEQGQFKAIQARIKKQAKPLLQALGGAAALQHYQPSPTPTKAQWWWYIDKIVAAQQKQQWQQLAIIGVIILVLFGLVTVAMNTILAPDPEVIARYETERATLDALDAGQYDEALTIIKTSLQKNPNETGFLLMQGVLQELLQKPEANQTFQQVETLINNPFEFHLGRGQLYLRTNQYEQAATDLQTALKIDNQSALVWLLLGQALESQNKKIDAMIAYEKAGTLALDKGESEIVVSARMALMRLGALNIPGTTPQ